MATDLSIKRAGAGAADLKGLATALAAVAGLAHQPQHFVIATVHWALQRRGLSLPGGEELLPDGWTDAAPLLLNYEDERSTPPTRYTLRTEVREDQLLLELLRKKDLKVTSLAVDLVAEIIAEDENPAPHAEKMSPLRNPERLVGKIRETLIDEHFKEAEKEKSSSSTQPERDIPGPSPSDPPRGYQDVPGYWPPIGVGSADLNPLGLGPRGPGEWFGVPAGGGGMLYDMRRPPRLPGPRFDPPLPPGPSDFEPNPDHFRPPGFDPDRDTFGPPGFGPSSGRFGRPGGGGFGGFGGFGGGFM